MQEDMLGSHFRYGYGDVLDCRTTELCCAGYGRGDMHGKESCDESGANVVNGEIGDTGDGAGSAEGYGIEDGTSEVVY